MSIENSPSIMETVEVGDTLEYRDGGLGIVRSIVIETVDPYSYPVYIQTEYMVDENYTMDGRYLLSSKESSYDVVNVIKKEKAVDPKITIINAMIEGLEKLKGELE